MTQQADTSLDIHAELEPLKYPGPQVDHAALIRYGRLTRISPQPGRRLGQAVAEIRHADGVRFQRLNRLLLEENATSVDSRVVVVAIGSNGSPLVLQRKMLDHHSSVVVPLVPCLVRGIGVGHSGHVSKRGYVAAAPFPAKDEELVLNASWLDQEQLRVLDSTEPNYERVYLSAEDFPIELSGSGERLDGFYLYVSKRGVLAEAGQPIRLLPQSEIHATLSKWLGSTSIVDPSSPAETVARLSKSDVARSVEEKLVSGGHVADCWPVPRNLEPVAARTYGATYAHPPSTGNSLPILRSSDDTDRHGEQCVSLNPVDQARLGLTTHAAVSSVDSLRPAVVARLVVSDVVPAGRIEVDQVVRNALGVELQEEVQLSRAEPTTNSVADVALAPPRFLMARVQAADIAIAEQQGCLASPVAMTLLGLVDGDTVVIEGSPDLATGVVPKLRIAIYQAPDEVTVRRESLSGGGVGARFPSASELLGVYPDLPWLYLDAAQRTALGLGRTQLPAVRLRVARRDKVFNEVRELLLVLLLGLVGITSALGNPFVLVAAILVVVVSLLLVRARLRRRL